MRKTRLVILPTKCLHQMGFLLLFLSCPVIGDWGRIRPESENSHNAIQIERKGTCGLERDPPGGLLGFLNENGSNKCQPSEDYDSIAPIKAPVVELTRRSVERRVDVRRIDEQRKVRATERRSNVNDVRRTNQRIGEERRDVRESERRIRRDVRSRSVESRRSSYNRQDVRTRSLSLNRMDEKAARRSVPASRSIRQYDDSSRRERLHLSRRANSRQNERRVDQRRLNRELTTERRENIPERREVTRFPRAAETERRDIRRERSNEPSMRRENDMTRRQSRERVENTRERTETRLSLARREKDARRTDRTDYRRTNERLNSERRLPDIRKTRSMESLSRISERRETTIRREIDSRRFAPTKHIERRIADERIEPIKSRRIATIRIDNKPEPNLSEEENYPEGITKWMDMTSYENFKAGDWTTNCVIGAVVYFLTTRQQVKAV